MLDSTAQACADDPIRADSTVVHTPLDVAIHA